MSHRRCMVEIFREEDELAYVDEPLYMRYALTVNGKPILLPRLIYLSNTAHISVKRVGRNAVLTDTMQSRLSYVQAFL